MQKIKIIHEETKDGARTSSSVLWEGAWKDATTRQMKKQTHLIAVRCNEDLEGPMELCQRGKGNRRDLTDKETELIIKEGHVLEIEHLHPHGPGAGSPIGAAPFNEVWRGICGNIGFRPHPHMTMKTSSPRGCVRGVFYLTMRISDKAKVILGL